MYEYNIRKVEGEPHAHKHAVMRTDSGGWAKSKRWRVQQTTNVLQIQTQSEKSEGQETEDERGVSEGHMGKRESVKSKKLSLFNIILDINNTDSPSIIILSS